MSAKLSRRQLQVLAQAGMGLTNEEIGTVLEISPRTVQGHMQQVFAALGVNSRCAALATLGWVRIPAEYMESDK